MNSHLLRSALLLLALLSWSSASAQGGDDAKALAFYEKYFERAAGPRTGGKEAPSLHAGYGCATHALSSLEAYLSIADISPGVRRVLAAISHPNSPELPEVKQSKHFTVHYTVNNADAIHNADPALIDTLLPVMDAYYEQYVKGFKKILPTSSDGKILVEIYAFDRLGGIFPGANGFTSVTTPIAINATHLRRDSICSVRDTIAHELFHRVQFAHGMYRHRADEDPFFVEGMAQWAPSWINPKAGKIVDFIAQYFNAPGDKGFKERAYEVSHFWIYLDERFQEFAGKKARGRVIDSILDAYDRLGSKRTLYSILTKSVSALVAVEDEKAKKSAAYKAPPFIRFMQEWHVTNGLKDFGVKTRRLAYESFSAADDCGAMRQLFPTTITGGQQIANDNTFYTASKQLKPGAAHYYNFSLDSNVKSLKIDLESPNGKLAMSAVGVKDSKVKLASGEFDDEISFDLKIKPGSIDILHVVVSSAPDAGVMDYSLSVNDRSLTGTWYDSFTYIGKVSVKEDNKQIITGRHTGFYLLSGTRTPDIITIRLDAPPGSGDPYSGTYRFRLCPSGKTMVGTFKDDDDLRNGTAGNEAYWCRFIPSEVTDDSECNPYPDPTCAGVVRPPAAHP